MCITAYGKLKSPRFSILRNIPRWFCSVPRFSISPIYAFIKCPIVYIVYRIIMFIFPNSYYLYEISHPNEYGVPQLNLSDDDEAKIDKSIVESLSLNVERVIVRLFNHYHCDAVIIDRIRSVFTSKLARIGNLYRHLEEKNV